MSHATSDEATAPPQTSDRIINEPECKKTTNLSRTTRWRLMRKGLFPQKVRLSPNRTGWKLSQVLDWVEAREAA